MDDERFLPNALAAEASRMVNAAISPEVMETVREFAGDTRNILPFQNAALVYTDALENSFRTRE